MAKILAGLKRLRLNSQLPVQVAAVCYRIKGSSVEFLLVNTSSGKWTFPKGRLNPALSPSECAACEALEEAGAKGRIAERHFSSYLDIKRALRAQSRQVRIVTFLMEVQSTTAPQESGRNPIWVTPRAAKRQLAEGRSLPYAKQIGNIIDSALDRLCNPKTGSPASAFAHAQGRRRLTHSH